MSMLLTFYVLRHTYHLSLHTSPLTHYAILANLLLRASRLLLLAYCFLLLASYILHRPCIMHHPSFTLHHQSTMRPSSIICPMSYVIYPSSLIVHHPSCTRPSSIVFHFSLHASCLMCILNSHFPLSYPLSLIPYALTINPHPSSLILFTLSLVTCHLIALIHRITVSIFVYCVSVYPVFCIL